MIDLKGKLQHLLADKIAGLEFITDKIIETGDAEIIVLYNTDYWTTGNLIVIYVGN